MDLPGGNPPCLYTPNYLLASRHHGVAGPLPVGGGLRGRHATHPSRLHSVRGEPPGRCGIALPVSAGLASRRQRVSSDIDLVGNTPDRPLRVAPVGANGVLYVLTGSGLTGNHRRPFHGVELPSDLPLTFHSPPQEGCEEAGGVEGDLSPRHSILGGPDVVHQLSLSVASSPESPPPPVPRRSCGRPRDGGIPSDSGTTFSSRLEDLRGSWGVDAVSDRSFRLIAAGRVRKGLAILQVFPARFLRSSPSGVFEDGDRLSVSPLRRGYVMEFHSHPQIHDFKDDGAS
jgi:hypothetical protein